MLIYTVEIFNGDGYDLVLATHDKESALAIDPVEYDSHLGIITEWENGRRNWTKKIEILDNN